MREPTAQGFVVGQPRFRRGVGWRTALAVQPRGGVAWLPGAAGIAGFQEIVGEDGEGHRGVLGVVIRRPTSPPPSAGAVPASLACGGLGRRLWLRLRP